MARCKRGDLRAKLSSLYREWLSGGSVSTCTNERLPNAQGTGVQIHVLPTQPKSFTLAQAERNPLLMHPAIRLGRSSCCVRRVDPNARSNRRRLGDRYVPERIHYIAAAVGETILACIRIEELLESDAMRIASL